MSLRSTLGVVRRRILCGVHRRLLPLGQREPLVSFCFDDFPRTAYTTGGNILKEVGARGTYYVAVSLMNTSNNLGELCRTDDLHRLADEGHELGTQTYTHISCRRLPISRFREDVRRGRDAIRVLGLNPSSNFAYPYGEVTIAAKKALGEDMASCRGIYDGVNGPLVDLNLLRANSLYGGLEKRNIVESLLAQNQAQKGWLIFYTHDIRENHSKFGCTPRLFEEAVSRAIACGSRIMTVAQVLDRVQGMEEISNSEALVSHSGHET